MTSRTLEESVRIYGPPSYRAWGYRLPCVTVGCETTDYRPGSGKVIECCHATTDGIALKATWKGCTFFGCWRCHDEQGQGGIETFARNHDLAVNGVRVFDLVHAASETLKQFMNYDGGLAE